MATLYLLHYNNYYNRIIKQESTLSAYSAYVIGSALTGINFNPNDGIETEQIINWNLTTPDYVIVADELGNIDSRWFVVEAQRTRAGQFRLSLHRDVVADHYDQIIEAPIFIEKASVPVTSDLIFNQESDRFNQIKKSETLLQDDTHCPWIVGYISSKDVEKEGAELTPTITGIKRGVGAVDITVSNRAEFFSRYYSGLNTVQTSPSLGLDIYGPNSYQLIVDSISANQRQRQKYTISANGVTNDGYTSTNNWTSSDLYMKRMLGSTETTNPTVSRKFGQQFGDLLSGDLSNVLSNASLSLPRNSAEDLADIMENNGKVIYSTADTRYYRVTITNYRLENTNLVHVNGNNAPTFSTQLRDFAADCGGVHLLQQWSYVPAVNSNADASFELTYTNLECEYYHVQLSAITQEELTLELPSDALRPHLEDAPYDMFAIPYTDDVKFYVNGTEQTLAVPFNKGTAFNIAMEMAAQWSGVGFIYDIQLLPYCPLNKEQLKYNDGIFTGIELGTSVARAGKLYKDQSVYGYVPFCTQSKFEIDIPYNITVTDVKLENQCDLYRLCSPNFGAYFDFNAARNGGVNGFNVDCQYKPFTPYIHVNPNFGKLYGQDFNDARGLICAADFSLPIITDQWETYQYQNKNYANIFDRQMENMDFNHKYDMIEQGANAIAGVVSGISSGAVTGGMLSGGPIGAAIGGVIGGAASLSGAAADMAISKKKYAETKSFATDTFNMQLDNVRALPNTLTRVSSFNNNNKIFPLLEYYTCTDVEKEAFRNKLLYNGMSVNAIGTIAEYQQTEPTFIKGRLIRLESVSDDFHMIGMIAEELNKGVFI